MARLTLSILGGFAASLDETPLSGLKTDKARALLICLAVEHTRPHRRQALAGLLWPDYPEEGARANLRHALANLRQVLEKEHNETPFLLVEGETLQLNPESDCQVDGVAFERLASSAATADLESAAALYRGGFLEGFTLKDSPDFDGWTAILRERYLQLASKAMAKLGEQAAQDDDSEKAIAYARRRLALEPWQEEAHQQLMRFLALNGQRASALAQYEVCKKILKEELSAKPSAETVRLFEEIRSGKLGSAAEVESTVELPNPYKGLRAFQETDADDFFGRRALVERLLSRLASPSAEAKPDKGASRFLAVVGPSSSGKTSLIKAGLIPALRQGKVPGSENWQILEMVPGEHPFEELEIGLLRLSGKDLPGLMQQLQRDECGLLRAARLALPDKEGELLLVIDQFEELFTLVHDKAEVAHFLDGLATAVSDAHSCLRLVIGLRADFYDRPLVHPSLGGLMQSRTEVVLPMSAKELSSAIQKPAEKVGMVFEEGLVAAILADVIDQPGSLPLLQYALTELFERRQDNRITFQAYRSLGGLLGVLGRRADEVYAGLEAEGQALARQLFLRLVALGEGTEDTRRRALRSELETLQAEEGAMQRVIDVFGRIRLLSFDRDPLSGTPTVEVAHEALGPFSWSPDGTKIGLFTDLSNTMRIIDSHTFQTFFEIGDDNKNLVLFPRWSPDGKTLAVSYEKGVVKIWDTATWQLRQTFAGHTGRVNGAAWSPDGKRLVSGDNSGLIKVWNAADGQEVMSVKAPAPVWSVHWSPDGTMISAAGHIVLPIICRAWSTTEDLIAYVKDNLVWRELSPAERQQFGLPGKK